MIGPTVPISKVKDKLNEFVAAVSLTHDQVTITKNGTPAAILVGAAEWESLQATLCWLSQPGVLDDIAEARRENVEAGSASESDIRSEFDQPRRTGR